MGLHLSRKVKQAIRINGDITVTIEKIAGNRVILSIDAPPDVSIDRQEVHFSKRLHGLRSRNPDEGILQPA